MPPAVVEGGGDGAVDAADPTEGARVGPGCCCCCCPGEGGAAALRAALLLLLLLPIPTDGGRLLLLLKLPPMPPPTPTRPRSKGLRRSREAGRAGRCGSRRRALQCTAPSSQRGTGLSGSCGRASCQLKPKAGSRTLNRKW
jgi:hypothetical protein